jgi:hypothetical protein
MWKLWPVSRPKKNELMSIITGRELSGFLLDSDRALLRLRFSDNTAVLIDLTSRVVMEKSAYDYKEWLMLPGWLRIINVIEDASQIILVVSGAIYTSRISFRHSQKRWQIYFSSGWIL